MLTTHGAKIKRGWCSFRWLNTFVLNISSYWIHYCRPRWYPAWILFFFKLSVTISNVLLVLNSGILHELHIVTLRNFKSEKSKRWLYLHWNVIKVEVSFGVTTHIVSLHLWQELLMGPPWALLVWWVTQVRTNSSGIAEKKCLVKTESCCRNWL